MSNSTFCGQSQLFWSCLASIVAVITSMITTLLLLYTLLTEKLSYPNLVVNKKYSKLEFLTQTPNSRPGIHISWIVENKPLLHFWGAPVVDLETKYWFDKKGERGWAYRGSVDMINVLPIKRAWPQEVYLDSNQLEERDYTLVIVFTSHKKVIKVHQEDIPYKKGKYDVTDIRREPTFNVEITFAHLIFFFNCLIPFFDII